MTGSGEAQARTTQSSVELQNARLSFAFTLAERLGCDLIMNPDAPVSESPCLVLGGNASDPDYLTNDAVFLFPVSRYAGCPQELRDPLGPIVEGEFPNANALIVAVNTMAVSC